MAMSTVQYPGWMGPLPFTTFHQVINHSIRDIPAIRHSSHHQIVIFYHTVHMTTVFYLRYLSAVSGFCYRALPSDEAEGVR